MEVLYRFEMTCGVLEIHDFEDGPRDYGADDAGDMRLPVYFLSRSGRRSPITSLETLRASLSLHGCDVIAAIPGQETDFAWVVTEVLGLRGRVIGDTPLYRGYDKPGVWELAENLPRLVDTTLFRYCLWRALDPKTSHIDRIALSLDDWTFQRDRALDTSL